MPTSSELASTSSTNPCSTQCSTQRSTSWGPPSARSSTQERPCQSHYWIACSGQLPNPKTMPTSSELASTSSTNPCSTQCSTQRSTSWGPPSARSSTQERPCQSHYWIACSGQLPNPKTMPTSSELASTSSTNPCSTQCSTQRSTSWGPPSARSSTQERPCQSHYWIACSGQLPNPKTMPTSSELASTSSTNPCSTQCSTQRSTSWGPPSARSSTQERPCQSHYWIACSGQLPNPKTMPTSSELASTSSTNPCSTQCSTQRSTSWGPPSARSSTQERPCQSHYWIACSGQLPNPKTMPTSSELASTSSTNPCSTQCSTQRSTSWGPPSARSSTQERPCQSHYWIACSGQLPNPKTMPTSSELASTSSTNPCSTQCSTQRSTSWGPPSARSSTQERPCQSHYWIACSGQLPNPKTMPTSSELASTSSTNPCSTQCSTQRSTSWGPPSARSSTQERPCQSHYWIACSGQLPNPKTMPTSSELASTSSTNPCSTQCSTQRSTSWGPPSARSSTQERPCQSHYWIACSGQLPNPKTMPTSSELASTSSTNPCSTQCSTQRSTSWGPPSARSSTQERPCQSHYWIACSGQLPNPKTMPTSSELASTSSTNPCSTQCSTQRSTSWGPPSARSSTQERPCQSHYWIACSGQLPNPKTMPTSSELASTSSTNPCSTQCSTQRSTSWGPPSARSSTQERPCQSHYWIACSGQLPNPKTMPTSSELASTSSTNPCSTQCSTQRSTSWGPPSARSSTQERPCQSHYWIACSGQLPNPKTMPTSSELASTSSTNPCSTQCSTQRSTSWGPPSARSSTQERPCQSHYWIACSGQLPNPKTMPTSSELASTSSTNPCSTQCSTQRSTSWGPPSARSSTQERPCQSHYWIACSGQLPNPKTMPTSSELASTSSTNPCSTQCSTQRSTSWGPPSARSSTQERPCQSHYWIACSGQLPNPKTMPTSSELASTSSTNPCSTQCSTQRSTSWGPPSARSSTQERPCQSHYWIACSGQLPNPKTMPTSSELASTSSTNPCSTQCSTQRSTSWGPPSARSSTQERPCQSHYWIACSGQLPNPKTMPTSSELASTSSTNPCSTQCSTQRSTSWGPPSARSSTQERPCQSHYWIACSGQLPNPKTMPTSSELASTSSTNPCSTQCSTQRSTSWGPPSARSSTQERPCQSHYWIACSGQLPNPKTMPTSSELASTSSTNPCSTQCSTQRSTSWGPPSARSSTQERPCQSHYWIACSGQLPNPKTMPTSSELASTSSTNPCSTQCSTQRSTSWGPPSARSSTQERPCQSHYWIACSGQLPNPKTMPTSSELASTSSTNPCSTQCSTQRSTSWGPPSARSSTQERPCQSHYWIACSGQLPNPKTMPTSSELASTSSTNPCSTQCSTQRSTSWGPPSALVEPEDELDKDSSGDRVRVVVDDSDSDADPGNRVDGVTVHGSCVVELDPEDVPEADADDGASVHGAWVVEVGARVVELGVLLELDPEDVPEADADDGASVHGAWVVEVGARVVELGVLLELDPEDVPETDADDGASVHGAWVVEVGARVVELGVLLELDPEDVPEADADDGASVHGAWVVEVGARVVELGVLLELDPEDVPEADADDGASVHGAWVVEVGARVVELGVLLELDPEDVPEADADDGASVHGAWVVEVGARVVELGVLLELDPEDVPETDADDGASVHGAWVVEVGARVVELGVLLELDPEDVPETDADDGASVHGAWVVEAGARVVELGVLLELDPEDVPETDADDGASVHGACVVEVGARVVELGVLLELDPAFETV
ncbi:hypothetical protein PRNP1_001637 [Phytophthora ramorum]